MENNIKVILAIALFVCLLDMPYGYYQLVRLFAFGTFAYLGFTGLEKANSTTVFIYFGLAILFQPFYKFALGRELWNIVDVVVGIGLLTTLGKGEG